jgi:hypothetical protein
MTGLVKESILCGLPAMSLSSNSSPKSTLEKFDHDEVFNMSEAGPSVFCFAFELPLEFLRRLQRRRRRPRRLHAIRLVLARIQVSMRLQVVRKKKFLNDKF